MRKEELLRKQNVVQNSRISFHMEEENLCGEYAPAIENSELANSKDLDVVTKLGSHTRRNIVEIKFENADDFDKREGPQRVTSIKPDQEEDILRESPENTGTNISFYKDGISIERKTHSLEREVECKIEETQILFGTESTPAIQTLSGFANGKDVDPLATSSLLVNTIKRSRVAQVYFEFLKSAIFSL